MVKGDNAQAITDFDKAIQVYPKYVQAFNNRCLAYIHKGDSDHAITAYDHAIADCSEAVRLDPNYAEALSI